MPTASALSRLKKIVKILFWTVMLLIPVALASSYILAKKVRSLLIEELNKTLAVPVDMYSLDISLWSNFPNINIRATGLQIRESQPFYRLNAVEADELSLVFNIFEVLAKDIAVDKIKLRGARIRLYKGRYGVNYNFFKPTEKENESPLNLELKKLLFENCSVWYIDDSSGHSANFETKSLLAYGKMNEEKYMLKLDGDALFDHLKVNGNTLFKGKKISLETAVNVNSKVNSYEINKGYLKFSDLELDVSGDILMAGKNPDFDLAFNGRNMQLNSLISLLPNKSFGGLKQEHTNGAIFLKGKIKGRFTEESLPDMKIEFGGDKISYSGDNTPVDLKDLTFKGLLEKSKIKPDGILKVEITKLQLGNGNVSAKLDVNSLLEPHLQFSSAGNLNLAGLKNIVYHKDYLDWAGFLEYNLTSDVQISRNGDGWSYRFGQLDGDINAREGMLLFAKDSFKIYNAETSLTIRNNDLMIHTLSAHWYENDALLKGTWENFVPWLNDSFQRIIIDGSLVSRQLDFNQAIPLSSSESEESSTAPTINDISLDVVIGKAAWRKHQASDLKGHLDLFGENILITDLSMKTMDGKINADLAFEEAEEGQKKLNLKLITDHIDIAKLFERFNDFEQSEITHKHLEGFLKSEIVYEQLFLPNGEVDMASINGKGILEITKGRLRNYKTLESLSKFVDLKELQDIRFSDLKNTILIEDETITIPHMKINNNALNLEISGTHTFDNVLDYHMRIFLSDLIAAKYDFVKRKKEKKVEQEKGGLSAYIHIHGPADKLEFDYDKKKVSQKIKQEAKNERKEFFEAIKKDFKSGIKEPEESTPSSQEDSIWDE